MVRSFSVSKFNQPIHVIRPLLVAVVGLSDENSHRGRWLHRFDLGKRRFIHGPSDVIFTDMTPCPALPATATVRNHLLRG